MKFYCFVAVVASLALTTSALNCWICENAKTNQECMDRGSLKQCQPNQQACQNEVRTDNQGLRITKRCKQAHACDNNFIQNPRPAWFPTQCNLDIPHSVCRCCCNTDECNKPLLGCLGARCTPAHTNPANGRVECSDSNNDGSVCTFTCNPGYELVGGPASTCTVVDDVGAWSSPAPTCRPTRCIPPQSAPFNGGVSCTNGNTVGSVCSFTCDAGYFLQGSTSTTCGEDNRWTNRPPICPAIVCPPPQSAPVNGGVSCSNGNRLGSDCAFTCDAGYTLIGDTNRVCVDDNDNDAQGVWTNSVPTCRRNVCDPPHVDPTNGLVDCSDSNNEGSVCEFVCNAGYSLVGDQTSQCLNIDGVGVWSTQAPVCQRITCEPPHSAPANGAVTCTDSNNESSDCTFRCDANFALVGAPVSTCRDDGNGDVFGLWSTPAPTCEPIVCEPPQDSPSNGQISCSLENFATSICTFTCDPTYALVGNSEVTCLDDGDGDTAGVWSSPPPTCQPIVCLPPHVDPQNGGVSCSLDNRETSVCDFTCNEGYALVGEPSSTCLDDGNGDALGVWSFPAPVCEQIVCEPPQANPEFGAVSCSNENIYASECAFACDANYHLEGEPNTACVDDGDGDTLGVWTNPAPACNPIVCDPQQAPDFGTVSCSNDNRATSVCSFECEPGYALIGSDQTTCLDDGDNDAGGVWTNPPPTCEPITCTPEQVNPVNGDVVCSNGNAVDSDCTFNCNPGTALVGAFLVTCLDDLDGDAQGIWSEPPPTCEPITCPPPRSSPLNGAVECSAGIALNSECSYACDDGYALVGSPSTTCVDDGNGDPIGNWNNPEPVCERKTCGVPPAAPENGFRVCTDGNFLGSQCEFGCDPFHTRVGPLYTNCIEPNEGNLIWDNPAPICQPNECPDQGVLLHGNYSCSNDNFATSTCTFECTGEGYEIYPPGRDQNTCLNDTAWTLPKPCCARDCPPYAVMDAVFILDSSSSIGDENWPIMQDFVRTVLSSYILAPDSARLAVFRYNRAVDTNSEILLGDFDNIDDFIAKFNEIPYDGSGTRTGNALNHTRNVIFQEANGDRPNVKNVALVITDGRSQDDVGAISEQLRADGVLTYALGIQPPSGSLDEGQLNQIAGDPGRLLIAEGSFADLGESLSNQLAEQICGDPCFDAHLHDELTSTVAP